MDAVTINCPMCGAPTLTNSLECGFCGAKLAGRTCPKCFGMMLLDAKTCPHCGTIAPKLDQDVNSGKNCPRCKEVMRPLSIGNATMLECHSCAGLWLDSSTFAGICASRDQQSAILGTATIAPAHAVSTEKVNYIPCPECHQLMNRANFARCSGVIIDLCKQHGIWFDQNELSRIVQFVMAGGLEKSRARELEEIEEERRKLKQEQLALDLQRSTDHDNVRISGIASAGGLLKLLLD